MSLRNISNFFNIIKKGRLKSQLADTDMIPVGTRDITNKSVYQDTAISFKDLKSQVASTSGVTAVTGTAPVVSSGGTTPAISMPKATGSTDGFLDSASFTAFSGKQDALTFNPPSSNNANPSTSAEIKTALDAKQDTIADGDLTIAKTSGLQTALDAKQDSLTLTTTGSGAATLVGSTLNVPTPAGGSGSWTANGSNISNSNAGNVGIGTTTLPSKLTIQGNGSSGMTSAFQIRQSGVATPWLSASDAGMLSLTAVGTAEAKLRTAKLQLTTTPAAGKVLTSDASGNATWETPTGMNTATHTLGSGSIRMGSSTTILSAPAATQYYVIHSIVMKFKAGSVAYNNSTVYGFNMERGVIDTSVAAAAGPATSVDIPTNTTDIILAWVSGATAPGQALTCSKVGGTTPSAGDSDVVFDVTYELKDF